MLARAAHHDARVVRDLVVRCLSFLVAKNKCVGVIGMKFVESFGLVAGGSD